MVNSIRKKILFIRQLYGGLSALYVLWKFGNAEASKNPIPDENVMTGRIQKIQ